jgi:HAD superfamily hydrolase (TIGR01484 family)
VTDVDDTLLGDDDAYRDFQQVAVASPGLRVALNSSRPVASIERTLESLEPAFQPAAVIGAMGTEIRYNGRLLSEWTTRFGDWSRHPIDDVMAQLGFSPHDDEYQTSLKASFVVAGEESQQLAREAIAATGQSAKIVTSGTSDFDVLPPDADKGEATLFIAELLGVPLTRLIVAGDSANDVAMFGVAERGIVVGNAREELRRAVNPECAYLATESRARGLLEGLKHYGVPIRTESVIQ